MTSSTKRRCDVIRKIR